MPSQKAPLRSVQRTFFWMLGPLGFVAGVLSIVALIQHAVADWQWQPLAGLIVESWHSFLEALFTVIPVQLLLEGVLSQIARLLNIGTIPTLHSHWQDVFVLLSAVFGAHAKELWERKRYRLFAYGTAVSLVIALLASLIAGLVPLERENVVANVVVASGPSVLFFFAVYLIWLPLKNEPYESHTLPVFLIRAVVTFVVSAGFTWGLTRFEMVTDTVHAGLVTLTGFAFVVAANRILCGWASASKKGGDRWKAFLHDPLTMRGAYILGAFLSATVFAVLGAAERISL